MRIRYAVMESISALKPGKRSEASFGAMRNATMPTSSMKAKNAENTESRNSRAAALPSSRFLERKGINTESETIDALQMNIRSGTRNAA